jgi:hypothetical protein
LAIRFQPVGLKNEKQRDGRKGLRKKAKGREREKEKVQLWQKLQKDILRI